jgi:hypothetical protein
MPTALEKLKKLNSTYSRLSAKQLRRKKNVLGGTCTELSKLLDLNRTYCTVASTGERGVPLLDAANQHLKQLLVLNSSFIELCSVPQTPALLGSNDRLKSLLALNSTFTKSCSDIPKGAVLAGASPTSQKLIQLNKKFSQPEQSGVPLLSNHTAASSLRQLNKDYLHQQSLDIGVPLLGRPTEQGQKLLQLNQLYHTQASSTTQDVPLLGANDVIQTLLRLNQTYTSNPLTSRVLLQGRI